MNTNHEETGVTVTLRKVGQTVHLGLSLGGATPVEVALDDASSVYTAMHKAKDVLAAAVSEAVTRGLQHAIPDDEVAAFRASLTGEDVRVVTPSEAAAVLDGKQVATPVAQVDDSYDATITHGGFFAQPDIDAAHEAALAEDAERSAQAEDDGDEPPTKTETPTGKRGRKAKAA